MEMDEDESMALYWDSPYAIAVALMEHHPDLDPEWDDPSGQPTTSHVSRPIR